MKIHLLLLLSCSLAAAETPFYNSLSSFSTRPSETQSLRASGSLVWGQESD